MLKYTELPECACPFKAVLAAIFYYKNQLLSLDEVRKRADAKDVNKGLFAVNLAMALHKSGINCKILESMARGLLMNPEYRSSIEKAAETENRLIHLFKKAPEHSVFEWTSFWLATDYTVHNDLMIAVCPTFKEIETHLKRNGLLLLTLNSGTLAETLTKLPHVSRAHVLLIYKLNDDGQFCTNEPSPFDRIDREILAKAMSEGPTRVGLILVYPPS